MLSLNFGPRPVLYIAEEVVSMHRIPTNILMRTNRLDLAPNKFPSLSLIYEHD